MGASQILLLLLLQLVIQLLQVCHTLSSMDLRTLLLSAWKLILTSHRLLRSRSSWLIPANLLLLLLQLLNQLLLHQLKRRRKLRRRNQKVDLMMTWDLDCLTKPSWYNWWWWWIKENMRRRTWVYVDQFDERNWESLNINLKTAKKK